MIARLLPLLTLLVLLVGAGPEAMPVEAEPPRIGSIVPAIGLYPLTLDTGKDADLRKATQLDTFCGLRPDEGTKAVLLLFVNSSQLADLQLADEWWKNQRRAGLRVLAVAIGDDLDAFKKTVTRAGFNFPVLDDRHKIVAGRYGIKEAPFSFLLNSECRLLGMGNRPITEDSAGIAAAIEAQLSGQLGTISGSMP